VPRAGAIFVLVVSTFDIIPTVMSRAGSIRGASRKPVEARNNSTAASCGATRKADGETRHSADGPTQRQGGARSKQRGLVLAPSITYQRASRKE
jgi:hypothetical protein